MMLNLPSILFFGLEKKTSKPTVSEGGGGGGKEIIVIGNKQFLHVNRQVMNALALL